MTVPSSEAFENGATVSFGRPLVSPCSSTSRNDHTPSHRTDGRTRLSDADVAELRAFRASGAKYVEISARYGISVSGVHAIVSGVNRTKPLGYRRSPVGTVAKRFYLQVKVGPYCWLWQGRISAPGYGQFKYENRTQHAHRIAYLLKHGSVPDGLFVLHRCDVKACVRPSHLYAGTAKDNTRDAVERGQHPIGERQGGAKLTDEQVRAIRASRRRGATIVELAAKYRVGTTTISYVCQRKSWRHVR